MSGPRPDHLSRRGAVYVIRLTLPVDLKARIGLVDLRRSLNTKNIDEARRRCLDAERWFRELVDHLRRMQSPTRQDIERAAAVFFAKLQADVDQPRQLPADGYDDVLAFNVAQTRGRIAELETQLRANEFGASVEGHARVMLEAVGLSLRSLDTQLGDLARRLAAKAEREQMRYLAHQLSSPAHPFQLDDPVFSLSQSPEVAHSSPGVVLETLPAPSRTVAELIAEHIAAMADQGQGQSHISEFERVARWFTSEFGADADLASITTPKARAFRDKLRRIDAKLRSPIKDGQKDLSSSLTDDRDRQIKSETARRYWSYIRALFRRAVSEGHLESDPVASLEISLRKDEEVRSPEPYSIEELKAFFSMPLFTGRRSATRRQEAGEYKVRDGHWWTGLLQAYTGMRGGELSQLYPSDFVFNAPVPHILVRREDSQGKPTKQVKNEASRRAIPIAHDLLVLGLRQFVEGRAKSAPLARVFREFPLGTKGKVSSGLSKFWQRHLRAHGLHKPGRAVHVWRHTIIYYLRQAGVPDEDIGYLVGHSTGSQTSRYGAGDLLSRVKDHSLAHLHYGFSVVDAVGGAYDEVQHAE